MTRVASLKSVCDAEAEERVDAHRVEVRHERREVVFTRDCRDALEIGRRAAAAPLASIAARPCSARSSPPIFCARCRIGRGASRMRRRTSLLLLLELVEASPALAVRRDRIRRPSSRRTRTDRSRCRGQRGDRWMPSRHPGRTRVARLGDGRKREHGPRRLSDCERRRERSERTRRDTRLRTRMVSLQSVGVDLPRHVCPAVGATFRGRKEPEAACETHRSERRGGARRHRNARVARLARLCAAERRPGQSRAPAPRADASRHARTASSCRSPPTRPTSTRFPPTSRR